MGADFGGEDVGGEDVEGKDFPVLFPEVARTAFLCISRTRRMFFPPSLVSVFCEFASVYVVCFN